MRDVRTVVKEFGQAFLRGDRALVESMLHDDVEYVIHGPPQAFPNPTAARGKQAVLAAMHDIDTALCIVRHDVKLRMADGDRVAVIAERAAVQRATGRTLTYKVATFLRVKDGQIIEYEAFYDSFDMLQQAIGQNLDVPEVYPR